jgi:hypothetical protein
MRQMRGPEYTIQDTIYLYTTDFEGLGLARVPTVKALARTHTETAMTGLEDDRPDYEQRIPSTFIRVLHL